MKVVNQGSCRGGGEGWKGGGEEEKSLDLKGAKGSMSDPLLFTDSTEAQRGKSAGPKGRAGSPGSTSLGPSTAWLPRGWKPCAQAGLGEQGGAFYYSYFPTREGPSSDGKPTGSAATNIEVPVGYQAPCWAHLSFVPFEWTPDRGTGLLSGWGELVL